MTKKLSYKPIGRGLREVKPWCVTSERPISEFPNSAPAISAFEDLDREGRDKEVAADQDPALAAKLETQQLLADAIKEADNIRSEARESGLAEGRELARAELEESQRQLANVVHQVREAYGAFCISQAPELAKLALQAAEKLVRDQLSEEPERITSILNHALEQITASAEITIHLHPDDVEIVRKCMGANQIRRVSGVELCAEPTVERGGCWIESEQGEVDATVSGRLSRLASSMAEL